MTATIGTTRPADKRDRSLRLSFARIAGLISLLEGVSFLFMASLHVGLQIPLGSVLVSDVRIVPATIVEGICGLGLVVAALALQSRQPWRWTSALSSQALALAGVLLGIASIAAGAGPHSVTNDTYHQVMAVLLVLGLATLLTPQVRQALKG